MPWLPQTAMAQDSVGRRTSQRNQRARPGHALVTAAGLGIGTLIVLSAVVGSSMLELLASLMAIGVSVFSPLAGLTTLAFVAPLARPLVIPSPGLYIVMMAAMLFGLVLRLPIDRPRLRLPSAEVLMLGAFVLYVAVDLVGGRLDGNAGPRATAIASMFARLIEAALVLGVAYVVLRDRSPFPILTALLLSAGLGSVVALAQVVGAEGVFGNLIAPTEGAVRITGAFDDPNYFGSYLAAMVALAVACLMIVRSPGLKAALLALATLLFVTLLFTQSRGALVALMAGLVVIAFLRSRRTGLLTAAILVTVIAVAYPLFSEWRFGDRALSSVADTAGRTEAWQDGLELFATAPLFGIGFGRFQEDASVGIAAHNWFVQVLAELGVAGLSLWGLFTAAVVLALSRRPRPAQTVGTQSLSSGSWPA